MTDSSDKVGEKSEAAVLHWLVEHNYAVLLPFGHSHRYDFVVDLDNGQFARLQCKTGRLRNGVIKFDVCSVGLNSKGYKVKNYINQIDYFAIYCKDTDKVYLININEVGSSEFSMRVTEPANVNGHVIRYARDYELG